MKTTLRFLTLTLATFAAGAQTPDIDYSRCNLPANLGIAPLNPQGQVVLAPGQRIKSKTTEGRRERYVIEYTVMGNKYNHELVLNRDEQGRVVRIQTGGNRVDRQTLDQMRHFHLQMQMNSIAAVGGARPQLSGSPNMEPVFTVTDELGHQHSRSLSQLSPSERTQLGMSDELLRDLQQTQRRDQRTVTRIERGLRDLHKNTNLTFPLGVQADFEIRDGICAPVTVETRNFHSRDGSVQNIPVFNRDACEEIQRLHSKHSESITRCQTSELELNREVMQNSSRLRPMINVPNWGGGAGMGLTGGIAGGTASGVSGGGLGGMVGGPGASLSHQIVMLQGFCQVLMNPVRAQASSGGAGEATTPATTQQ